MDTHRWMKLGTVGRALRARLPRSLPAVVVASAVMLGSPAPGAAQAGVVGGVVVDEQSLRPLAGAQVVVDGTQEGALADANGRFRITTAEAPGAQITLRAVMIGYRTATMVARVGATDVRIALSQAAVELDQVVVTGTPGATQRRAIGNVVAQVKAADVTAKAPIADMQQMLNGRVAGLVVMPGSGNVGTGGVTRIRGVSSLSLVNEPLIYVDGVRLNNDPASGPNIRQGRQVNRLNDINPEDIESIEVIKGPAAATLYGTEASNGVIQIITKKGNTGRPQFNLTVRQGANFMMDLADKIPTVYGLDRTTKQLRSVNLYQREKEAGRDPFQAGPVQFYGASLRGGTDQVRYYLSSDYDNTEGVVSYNWQHRLSTRANLNLLLNENLQVDVNTGFVHGKTRFAQAASGWGIWDQFVWGSPLTLDTRTRGFLRAPPEVVAEIQSYADIDRFTSGVKVSYRPWPWFAHRLTIGLDDADETNSILFPRNPAGSAYFFGGLSLGQKTVERRKSLYATVDYSATGTFNLTPGITSAVSAGAQYYTKRFENVDAEGQQFPAPPVQTVGGAAVTFADEDLIENKTFGLFLQDQLAINNRLFLTGAVRGDDNSAFGQNYEFVVYPKFSASWVINEEPFWKNISALDALRLRAAWGRAGQQPDVFAAARLYSPATGPGDRSVLTPQTIGNPDLAPEVGEELEVGLDAGLFSDRVGVSATYYDRHTRNAIVEKQVSPSLGFPGVQFANVGEVHSWGTEFSVDTKVLRGGRFGWDLGLKFSTNQNEVVDLGDLTSISIGGADQEQREGYPVGAIFYKRVVHAELDASGAPVNILCDGGPENGGQPVACSEAPRVFWGTPTPTWEGAVTSTLTLFRNLQLYGLVDFRGGHMFQDGDINAAHTTFKNSKTINEGTDAILAAYDVLGLTDATGFLDGGFAKLREVSATYTLPASLTKRFGASRASIAVAGRNLATLWVAQKDVFGQPVPDPEVRTPGSSLSAYVQTVLPPYSQFTTTVRVSF